MQAAEWLASSLVPPPTKRFSLATADDVDLLDSDAFRRWSSDLQYLDIYVSVLVTMSSLTCNADGRLQHLLLLDES